MSNKIESIEDKKKIDEIESNNFKKIESNEKEKDEDKEIITNKNENNINLSHISIKSDKSNKSQISYNKEEKEKALENSQNYPSVNYFKLQFTLASRLDILYFSLGIIGAAIMGAAFPIFSLFLGNSLNEFGDDMSTSILKDKIGDLSLKMIYAGLFNMFGCFMNILFSILCGIETTKNIKTDYFRSLLRQEQGFYDSRNAFEFSTKVQAQLKQISMGLGQKIGNIVMALTLFITSYIVGFIINWKLSLILCSIIPFMIISTYWMTAALTNSQIHLRKNFEEAGGIAEEVLYNIKTVASFSNYEYEKSRFNSKLKNSFEVGRKGAMFSSFGRALVFFFIFVSYAIAVAVAGKMISDADPNDEDAIKSGDIMTVIFTIVFGAYSIGEALPNYKAINAACEASREYFYIKERIPEIDIAKSIDKPNKNTIEGKIQFKDISFAYPCNLERKILKNLNFEFEKGKKIAIVGQTGSGKSTIVNLLERLYDPQSGTILLDGKDIKEIDLTYFRSMIGYVPQEPVLFNHSIKENIIFGRNDATDEELKQACEKAYLNDFLGILDKGLETRVGLRGSKLSGGQKQRVAIARAILKKPKILILDEATSALDYKSEKIIKKTLDNVSKDITTIVIAHRLSTIKNSDLIVVLDQGEIKEVGTHENLYSNKGLYYLIVKSQEEADKNFETENNNVDDQNNINDNSNRESVHKSEENLLNGNKPEIKNNNIDNENNKIKQDSMEDNFLPTQIKEMIREKKNLLEDEGLSLEERKKILLEVEKLNEKLVDKAKGFLWPILCENPSYLIISSIMSAINGAIWPIYGIFSALIITELSVSDRDEIYDNGINLMMWFIIISVIAGIANYYINYYYTLIGEYIAMRLRMRCYEKYLEMHVGFYDFASNSPGTLLTRLASDTTKLNGIALTMFSVIFESAFTLIIGIVLGLIYCWQVGLICMGFIPFMVISGAVGAKLQLGYEKNDEIKEKDLGNILSETITNTKSVYCYNMQDEIVSIYKKKQEEGGVAYFTYFISAVISGFSQFLMFAVFSVTFYVGVVLLDKENTSLTVEDVLKSVFTLFFAAFGVGMIAQYLGDMDEAYKAMISIYDILSSESEINPNDNIDKIHINKDNLSSFNSKIEFKNVSFKYPSRPDTIVFNNLSFVIEKGKQVAFVGFSGSGKSTIIQLILRFYDVISGEILINDVNIKDYNLVELRKIIGLVMQEPVLFKTNIYNNIRYGNLEIDDIDQIKNIAKKSLIPRINKISKNDKQSLPVSGGEKQRIAIARCMLKDPIILLLDEATSALDKNVEDEIQKSLDNLMIGRTSIIVAHRLSTIINCDKIFFLEAGVIKESGSHKELLEKKGRYYSLFLSSS